MKIIFKLLIISILTLFVISCKCTSDTTKNHKEARTDTTDDVVDEQMQDYEEAMKQ
jgi:competence protein ComGC